MKTKTTELLHKMQKAVKNTILTKKFGIAFSGGVDSSLLAKICSDLGYDITLFTVGFSDSHDIVFSKKISKLLEVVVPRSESDSISTKRLSCRSSSSASGSFMTTWSTPFPKNVPPWLSADVLIVIACALALWSRTELIPTTDRVLAASTATTNVASTF